MMRTATVTIKGLSPYSSSKVYDYMVPLLPRETKAAYEERTWFEKFHYDAKGEIYIPPMAFKIGLDAAAKMLGIQIPGKGKSNYTKFFTSGVLVTDPSYLGVNINEVKNDKDRFCRRVHANVDGVRGSGKRVWRLFPEIAEWETEVTYTIFADEITPDVFERCLVQCGSFIGVGRFRPEKGGLCGRYAVSDLSWSMAEVDMAA